MLLLHVQQCFERYPGTCEKSVFRRNSSRSCENKDDSLNMTRVQETNVQSNIGWIYCGLYLQPQSGGLMKLVGSSHGSL